MSATAVPTNHKELLSWVEEVASLTQPDAVHWCDGSSEEYDALCQVLVEAGTFERLNDAVRPNSYLALSDPGDVARVEDRTFICSAKEDDAGPTNNWRDPAEMRSQLEELFSGTMQGRTMYVVPFSMGPVGSDKSHIGVQLTDSAYVAVSMRLMTRMGRAALDVLGDDGDFVPCVHSVGMPLADGAEDVPWPNNETKYIVHFPESREIWSYGSGYGGNALLGKKCFALRIASVIAHDDGWLAEHMLILKLTSPEGVVKYVAAAFPSASGKTNLAMLIPTLPGWKAETIGDDIAWMKFGEDGRLYAINPEAGFFGVAPGTGVETNPNAIAALSRDVDLHERRQDRRRRHLVGGAHQGAARPRDRLARQRLDPRVRPPCRAPELALHGRSRPGAVDRPRVGRPGGRADRRVPVRRAPRDDRPARERGVRLGARRVPRRDDVRGDDGGPGRRGRSAALRPVRDAAVLRLQHGRLLRALAGDRPDEGAKLPKIFMVNWFRKSDEGKFLWPGFGENSRVLAYVLGRLEGEGDVKETPIGLVPTADSLPLEGLEIPADTLEELLTVDPEQLRAQLGQVEEHLDRFGDRLPAEVRSQFESLKARLS